ncbi:aliphatic sulfonate ABC transporter substrate-binding protein [Aciduricibacillus chroicocephali]|uniref:Aliphatic sulfonate ABC transporter substrate-binding protein n=1 Tax=Aciduricibacillus chroicocephali TaxID=3054939 RepID=A0ABY9KWC6_9BACI|nr:aliphatic sulfonate ABC transporter substrate-binding protein [Bacillaceae bacterium 44XB]
MKKKFALILITALFAGLLAACGNNDGGSSEPKKEVTIGYFPNLTHIATIVGLEKGYFKDAFGKDVKIKTKTVNNGGLFMEAMATNAIDIGTVGPGPAINYYVKDPKYHIVSGAVNGGAVLVADKDAKINSLKDLDGKKVAIPVIGSTQDVMLRKALNEVGLKPKSNGGTVDLHPAAPADTTTLFKQNAVDAAATQEPWGYVLETQADGNVILGWDKFAWGKDSTNTVVVTSDGFTKNKDQVKQYLSAHKKAVQFIKDNPDEAKKLVIKHLKDLTGKELDSKEVDVAFDHLQVTTDVNEKVIQDMAKISKEADYIPSDDVKGLVDLKYLKEAK